MNNHYLLGVEVGGSKLQAVLCDFDGKVFQDVRVSGDSAGGASAILKQLEAMINQLLSNCDDPVEGLGIGFGGPVDTSTGVVIASSHVSGWEGFSLRNWAEERFGLTCVVANDSDAAAIAEARVASRRRDRCVFYTNIGSGIGGGLVVDGELYARPGGAMEFGHNEVFSPMEQKYGILEEFCSGWSLDRRARQAAEREQESLLWDNACGDLDRVGAEQLFEAWQRGDVASIQVVDDFLECYARALSNVIALLNPDLVVIGGGVAQVGAPLLEAVRTCVKPFIYGPRTDTYRIELAAHGDQAVPIGAVLVAADFLSKKIRCVHP